MDDAEKEYADRLYDFIATKHGGKCLLCVVGELVPRPPQLKGKIKTILERHKDRFVIKIGSSHGEVFVHIVPSTTNSTEDNSPGQHKYQDLSLKQMFSNLFVMTTLFQRNGWMNEKEQLKAEFGRIGLIGFSKTLFRLKACGYLHFEDGHRLVWNKARVLDAVRNMPSNLKPSPPTITTKITTQPQEAEDSTVPCDSSAAVIVPEAEDSTVPCDSAPAAIVPSSGPAPANNAHEADESTVFSDPAPVDIVLGREHKPFRLSDGSVACYLIDDDEMLNATYFSDPYINAPRYNNASRKFVALDCEGVPDTLELVQVATPFAVYIFDCKALGVEKACQALEPLLTSKECIKLLHDLHQDAVAFERYGALSLEGVLDTQLVGEFLWGELHIGFNNMLSKFELKTHPSKDFVHARMKSGVDLWSERPIPQSYLEYAAMDVSCLLSAARPLTETLSEAEFEGLLKASTLRAQCATANNGVRAICFDTNNDYSIASAELIKALRPDEGFFGEPLVVESNTDEVVSVLPDHLRKKFIKQPESSSDSNYRLLRLLSRSNSQAECEIESFLPFDKLSDVVLDIGRRPQCWIEDKRVFLCEDATTFITKKEIEYISDQVGSFGSDNRAGLNGKLHRFSAIRNRETEILGITIRIGRHIRGNSAMIMDFLMGSEKSILILGEPGSGKTTIVREATRKLAEEKNVLVVDTSNEIAGDGVIPHHCIGLARRMMVPSLDAQSSVMIECVQNHTPHVMVIDEIGRPREVQAARTVKQRGVRIIASAHGDLRKLLKNRDLSGLVGGVEHVTVGDDMARQEASRKKALAEKLEGAERPFSVSKTKVQRAGDPTFEVIIEVQRGSRHEWRVVADSAKAVDRILDGFQYQAQLRTRNPQTGEMQMELINA